MTEGRSIKGENLFSSFAERLQKRKLNVEAFGLLSRSPQVREILAYGATRGESGSSGLIDKVRGGDITNLDAEWLAGWGRVTSLQDHSVGDKELGLSALRLANESLPRTFKFRRFHKLEAELLLEFEQYSAARDVIAKNDDLQSMFHGYLLGDLSNPFSTDSTDTSGWLANFNGPFMHHHLVPVTIEGQGGISL